MTSRQALGSVGIVWDMAQRLTTLAGGDQEIVLRYFQRMIDDPIYRGRVYGAMSGNSVMAPSREEWIEREIGALARCAECGLPKAACRKQKRNAEGRLPTLKDSAPHRAF